MTRDQRNAVVREAALGCCKPDAPEPIRGFAVAVGMVVAAALELARQREGDQ